MRTLAQRRRAEAFERLTPAKPPARVLMPVRYAAWLSGDLGRGIETKVKAALNDVPGIVLTRLPRGILVMAPESPGVLVEHVIRAAQSTQAQVTAEYPVFSHELGPVWTGSFSVVLDPPEVV